jgi:protein-L-isoaspartate(D-aspartate) O-methyltransferase
VTDTVAAAAAAVDYDSWVMTDDGHPIPQSTTDYLIHNMLVLLGVAPGSRILEIGTGSGYSGAVIAKAVGDGHLVSIDIDAGLVERAAGLHQKANHTNVEVHAADGFLGWVPAAPYDGVIGWTTPHVLPQAWVDQTADQGVIVTPVKLAEVAGANAVVRCVVSQGQPRDGSPQPGSFIELAPEVITDFALPIRYVDASRVEAAGPRHMALDPAVPLSRDAVGVSAHR